MDAGTYYFISTLLIIAIVLLVLDIWLTVKCPKCGHRMDYGTYGYDRHECLNCGHHQK